MPLGRLLVDVRPLREHRVYRRLWVGTAVSAIGTGLTLFAVPLQVYRLTGSSAAVGGLGVVRLVPLLTVGLLGGAAADRVDRRRLVLVTSTALAVVALGFAAQAEAGARSVALLYALTAAQSLLVAVDSPARRTFVPRLLPAHQLGAGQALTQLAGRTSLIVGPAVGGLIAAVAGLRLCYFLDAVSYSAALYGLARLPVLPPLHAISTTSVRAVVEGLRFIQRSPLLTGAFLADLDATVLGVPVALFPALNAEHFGGSAETLGLLTSAVGVGGLVASLLSGPVSRAARPGRDMLVTVALWGAAITAFGFTRTLWLALVLLAVAGAADTSSVTLRTTLVQAVTPDRLRGRISAVDFIIGAGGPQLGNIESGLVAAASTPVVSAVSGGIGTALGAGLIRVLLPQLAEHRHDPALPARGTLGGW